MSIEGSTKTPIHLTASTRVAAFIVAETSADLEYRDFVKFIEVGEDVFVEKCTEEEAFGQVLNRSLSKPGATVSVIYLYGGGSGAGVAYAGEDAFKSISGPDASSVMTLTRGDGSVETFSLIQDTNLARIVSASLVQNSGGGLDLTLTRDDSTTVTGTVASLSSSDFAGYMSDLSIGNLPDAQVGDKYFITTGGELGGTGATGIFTEAGDIAYWVDSNGSLDPQNDPGGWVILQGVQQADVKFGVDRQTVALAALTPVTITALNVTDIHSIQVYNSAGEMITSGITITKTANSNQRVLESNVALAGVVVEMTGSRGL